MKIMKYCPFMLLPILFLLLLASTGSVYATSSTQTVLHLLDYIAVDYAQAVEGRKIKNPDEYQEMREFASQAKVLIEKLPANPNRAKLLVKIAALARGIENKDAAPEIVARANDLRWFVIHAYNLQVIPKYIPDLRHSNELYTAHCAACHGSMGKGDGLIGKGLDPSPSNFHDIARMTQRSVYGLYNTITLGITDTGMASYRQFSEDDRWALAFYVSNFAANDKIRAEGAKLWNAGKHRNDFSDLTNVVALSFNEVQQRFGEDGVALQAYLRAHPEALAAKHTEEK